jgi:hypothetical protein
MRPDTGQACILSGFRSCSYSQLPYPHLRLVAVYNYTWCPFSLHTYHLTATMKLDLTLAAAALFAGSVNGLDLKAEHAGGVFNRVHGGKSCSDDGVINNGTASGQTVALGNGMVCFCIATGDSNI